ncbi:MAG: membrane protein insertase YidC [Balneolaceae bacterium]
MDRNTVIGLVLIFFIMMAWAFYAMPSEEDLQRQREERALQDSLARVEPGPEQEDERETGGDRDENGAGLPQTEGAFSDTDDSPPPMGIFRMENLSDTTETVIQTPRYRAVFTNLGAGLAKYELRNYKTWNQEPVQMIADTTRSAYVLGFLSSENYNIESDQLLFRLLSDTGSIHLNDNENATLRYALELDNGGSITYTYTFHANRYAIDLVIDIQGLDELIIGNNVDFGWQPRLNFTERDWTQDGQYAAAYVHAGGVIENFKMEEAGQDDIVINGTIDWVSTKTKFFTQIIKPETDTNAALLSGEMDGPADEPGTLQHYRSSIQSPIPADGQLSYQMYIGPLDYFEMREFQGNTFDMVEISYAWMRWFADPLVKWIIIPYFEFTSNWITNYGLLIILFGFLVKLLLAPLTQKSFKSMAAMKELQPQMKEIQEKHKDNPKKQQEETIKLYKKAKVNPLGGCLPMLLQFPILITLWRYFQNSILIRQEEFLWATDLSAPDYILNLPFTVPFLGDQVAGFVLLMTASMIVQMKVSGGMSGGAAPSGGPNMKPFMYMMPVMLLFIFNNFAAGLSLYYLVYNVLSIGQQFIINKQIDKDKLKEEVSDGNSNKSRRGKGRKKKKQS